MSEFDVFICHASEDKARLVEPLVAALTSLGVTVWYDRFAIGLGDDFRVKMDEGLGASRFGIVVLSPRFFKYWTQAEVSALFNLEANDRRGRAPRILPVLCDLSPGELTQRSPLLAARVTTSWELGLDAVAQRIAQAVRDERPARPIQRSPVYNVPARRAPSFIGRGRELDRIDALLGPGGNAQVAISIEGLGGVGKTELALHIVDRLAQTNRFPGGIFWLGDDHNVTATWGGPIADALAVGGATVEERAAAAIRLVSSGGPALIVLDNVTTADTAHRGPLPAGPHIASLVTTRDRDLAPPNVRPSAVEHIPIDTLAPDLARALLIEVAGRDLAAEPGLDELLAHLSGHALALELVGAHLRRHAGVSPAAYLARLRGSDIEWRGPPPARDPLHAAFDATWTLLDDAAQAAVRVMGWFAPEAASLVLLEACGVDDVTQATLQQFHLIDRDDDEWQMHPLVREYGQRRGTDEERTAAQRAFLEGCIARAEGIKLDDGFHIYRADRPHFERAITLFEVVITGEVGRVSRFLAQVGTGAHSAGDLPRARELMERALASAVATLGENHPEVNAIRAKLAGVLLALGDLHPARALLERALVSNLTSLTDDHPAIASVRFDLAGVLKELGDLPGARAELERAIAVDLANLGETHPRVTVGYMTLAAVSRDLGDLSRARDLLERALAVDLGSLGEDHPRVASERVQLASVLKDLGDLRGARELLERALASDVRSLGEDHPSIAGSRSNLALILKSLGDLRGARELLERALASDIRSLGEHHPSAATSRANLAGVLHDLGDLHGARDLLELALASGLMSLGDEHPAIATWRSNLAAVLHALGNLGRARELLELALASDRRNLGDDHPDVAARCSNLAVVLQSLGDPTSARQLLELALASDRKTFGDSHPTVALRSASLAGVMYDLGELGAARDILERTLASLQSAFGEDHPAVAANRANLAMVLRSLGQPDRARELLDRALAFALDKLGEDHPSVATSRANLALVLLDLGELASARDLLERALISDVKTLGEGHPRVAAGYSNLASVLVGLDDFRGARTFLERAFASTRVSLGEDHPSVATCRFNLAALCEREGDFATARDLFAQALLAEVHRLGANHPSAALTRARLASVLSRLGEHDHARTESQRALDAVRDQPAGSYYRASVERLASTIMVKVDVEAIIADDGAHAADVTNGDDSGAVDGTAAGDSGPAGSSSRA